MAKKPNKGRHGGQPNRPDPRPAPARVEPRPTGAAPQPRPAAPAPSRPEGDERARLRDALKTAIELRGASTEVASLPASLRTLGVGQVLASFAREGSGQRQALSRNVGVQLALRLGRVDPALAGEGLAAVLERWCALGDRRQVQVVEQGLLAWSVDLKLMLCLVEAPPIEGIKPSRWNREPRQASAVKVVVELRAGLNHQELSTRLASLPWELHHHGLPRTLAILHRKKEKGRYDTQVDGALAKCLYERLLGHPSDPFTARPLVPVDLVGALLDDGDGGARAATLEHEALAWAVELKRCASTFHAADGGQLS